MTGRKENTMTRNETIDKVWTIEDIEAMTEQDVQRMALETLTIKGHTVYLVDFGGYFGYSALVFAEGRHIHYADDYSLHHKHTVYEDDGTTHPSDTSRETLRELYIKGLGNKLFTEEEIAAPLTDYNEYDRKNHYLYNFYGMRREHLSIFGNFNKPGAEEEWHRRKAGFPFYDPYAFAYYKDETFVRHHAFLMDELRKAEAAMKDSAEYWEGAFLHEMYNHEYGINWQADYDTLSAFGSPKWLGDDASLTDYFDQLGFNDVQRKAYVTAQRRYYDETRDWA